MVNQPLIAIQHSLVWSYPLKLINRRLKAGGSRPAAQKGFTLIETIMVIVIIGILTALTIPRFNAFYGIKLKGALKKTVSDLRYIQQLSIFRHTDTRVEFDAAANSYQTCYCNESDGICTTGACGSNNWTYITDPFSRGNLQTYFNTDPQYRGIDITNTNFLNVGRGSALRFNWEGIPQDDNRANLASEGSVSFSYQGNTETIYVTPNTGRVRIQ